MSAFRSLKEFESPKFPKGLILPLSSDITDERDAEMYQVHQHGATLLAVF